jgi:hypothetical protein
MPGYGVNLVDDVINVGCASMSMSASVTAIELELDLNGLERLILAQAVYELGSDAWSDVSTILSHHPLISKRDNPPFSPSASFPPPLFFSFCHSTPLSPYRPAKLSMKTFYKILNSPGLS